jgi:hypothetical protein
VWTLKRKYSTLVHCKSQNIEGYTSGTDKCSGNVYIKMSHIWVSRVN